MNGLKPTTVSPLSPPMINLLALSERAAAYQAANEEAHNRIEIKVDRVGDGINGIQVTMARQQAILEEHQARSKANEAAVEILRGEMVPLSAFAKIAALAGGVLGFAMAALEIWRRLTNK